MREETRGTVTEAPGSGLHPCPEAPAQPGTVGMETYRDGLSSHHLACDASVCLFPTGWNVIAPRADSDKWRSGAYTPVSDGSLLLSLRPSRCREGSGWWAPSSFRGRCLSWGVRGSPGMFQALAKPAVTGGAQGPRTQGGQQNGNGFIGPFLLSFKNDSCPLGKLRHCTGVKAESKVDRRCLWPDLTAWWADSLAALCSPPPLHLGVGRCLHFSLWRVGRNKCTTSRPGPSNTPHPLSLPSSGGQMQRTR